MFKNSSIFQRIAFSFRNLKSKKTISNSSTRSFNLSNQNRRDRFDFGAVCLLFIPTTTFALGTWQIIRREKKLRLIEFLRSRTQAEPIELMENLNRLPEYEYFPIRVRGRFDHSREILLAPRTRLDEGAANNQQGMRPPMGAHVITPFRVSNQNFDILVNRGFIPNELRDPSTRIAGQIEDEHEIIGLLRTTDTLNGTWNKNEPENNIWKNRDVPEMATALRTAPIFIDQIKKNSVPGGPIGGQTNINLRNEHLSYILTWYSLSAFTGFMWLRKYVF